MCPGSCSSKTGDLTCVHALNLSVRLGLHGSHGGFFAKLLFLFSPGVHLTHMAHEHLREEEGSPYFEEGGVIFSLKAKEP